MKEFYLGIDSREFEDGGQQVPEKGLLAAIIRLAVSDYLHPETWHGQEGTMREDHLSAKRWLFAKPTEPFRPFSLIWVCQHLVEDSDPHVLRDGILGKVGELIAEQNEREAA